MKRRKLFGHAVVFFTLFFFLIPALCSGGGMGDFTADVAIATTYLHEWMPSIAYNPVENDFMTIWHTTGAREEGGENMYTLDGQRVSPEGGLIGPPFSPLLSVSPMARILPRIAHNTFKNQYMIAFSMGQENTGWDLFITILGSDGTILSDPICLSAVPKNASHPVIVFNPVRREYLISWNENRYGSVDVFGIIVDEDGSVVKDVFDLCTAAGDQYNPYICHNPTNDTYLINWEDFRNVPTWEDPGDIYGLLLDGEGNIIVDNIPMCDDHGTDNEGDQRLNNIAYNTDKNEFFVTWMDTRPSLDNGGIVARIFTADGVPAGPDFTLVDAIGSQVYPQLVYIAKNKRYFAVWQDGRNDEPDAGWETVNADIYAGWVSSQGELIGDDFPICTEARNQMYPIAAYSEVMDSILIAWRDELEEDIPGGTSTGHVTESGGNIMGKVYGVPSFLSGRVVEQGSGEPVVGASIKVIGPGYERTVVSNIGGWFNIPERFQRDGNYVALIRKNGYQKAMESAIYRGEPLKFTVELSKR